MVYFKFEQPYCGGKLDSSMLLCNKEDETKCNPKDDIIYYKDITKSLQYITRLFEKQSESFIIDPPSDNSFKVFKGVFFFGIPDILRALPTDFGQNSLSPYGFISFFPLYPSCISNKAEFCNELFDSPQDSIVNNAAQLACVGFLNGLAKEVGNCKFPVYDNNPNLYIENNAFFNEIGMLGAFSLYQNQCVILRFKIPQSQLRLLYWSFNFYIADSLEKNNICSPTYQAIVGSLTHSLNLFHVAAQTKKKNPFTDDFDIIILISYNDYVIQQVQKMIQTKEDLKDVDMVHVFKVPTAEGSLPISKNLPNPNLYNEKTRLFNPETDRLAVLLRLTPGDNTDEQFLQDYINQKNDSDPSKDRNDFKLNLLEFSSINTIVPYSFIPNPKQLKAPVNEFEIYGKTFRRINKEITTNLRLNLFNVKKLNVRNSLLNITAPLYRNLLKGDVPYQGGYQAVQLAGNMEGDNPDCQYRLGQSVCLTNDKSILMTFGLNHQAFQNCVFNTYNVTDSIKAYGYEAFVPDKTSTFLLYLIGRSKETLNYVSQQLEKALSKRFPNESIQTEICIVKTGTTQEFAIPYCHPMLNVERIYLNPIYSSLTDASKTYSIWNIFGDDLNEFKVNDISDDQWNSLINTTGPNLEHYIKPTMYQIEQNDNNLLVKTMAVIIGIVFFIIILIVIFMILYRKKFKKNSKGKRAKNV